MNNIKLNITAIFTYEQIDKILPIVKNTNTILSVFAGRIFDCGKDANQIMKEICEKVRNTTASAKCFGLALECPMTI